MASLLELIWVSSPPAQLPKIEIVLMTKRIRGCSLQQNKKAREGWHARRNGCSFCFGSDERRYDATGGCRGGRCRVCRPVPSASVAQGRLHGGGVGGGRRRRRHLVLEPISRRALRHTDHRLQLHLRSGAGDRVEMVGEIRNPAGNPALPRLRHRPL